MVTGDDVELDYYKNQKSNVVGEIWCIESKSRRRDSLQNVYGAVRTEELQTGVTRQTQAKFPIHVNQNHAMASGWTSSNSETADINVLLRTISISSN